MFQSFHAFSKMNFMMAITAKCLQIIERIIFSISIQMMYAQTVNIFLLAIMTNNFTKYSQTLIKTFCNIATRRIHSFIYEIRTKPRTKFFFTALESFSSKYYFSTKLTRMSLYAA